jgi:hypothetical protein
MATVGCGGTDVRVLGQNGGDTHGLAAIGLVFGLGCDLDFLEESWTATAR